MSFFIGVSLALAIGLFATWIGFDRDRAFYPTVMLVVASYYVLFALIGASPEALILELLVLVPFALAAVAGFKKTPWLLVAGLAGHGVLDVFHPHLIANPGAPVWWPGFCMGYDVLAAGYLAFTLLRGKATRREGVTASA